MNHDRAQLEALGNHQHEIEFILSAETREWEQGKQPQRTPDVGGLIVGIVGRQIQIESTESGNVTTVILSPYNAFRVWASLGMLLGLPIPDGTGIKL